MIRVEASLSELNDGTLLVGSLKSDAGVRKVALPSLLVPELRQHLEKFGEAGPKGLVFVGPKGAQLRRGNARRIWSRATTAAGVPSVHFHDLRHTGNTFTAATGASLRELMGRMGHSSSRAALIYQHATQDRDRLIAEMMDVFAQGELKPATGKKQGRARRVLASNRAHSGHGGGVGLAVPDCAAEARAQRPGEQVSPRGPLDICRLLPAYCSSEHGC